MNKKEKEIMDVLDDLKKEGIVADYAFYNVSDGRWWAAGRVVWVEGCDPKIPEFRARIEDISSREDIVRRLREQII